MDSFIHSLWWLQLRNNRGETVRQAAEGASKPVKDALRDAEKKRQTAPLPPDPDLADDDEL